MKTLAKRWNYFWWQWNCVWSWEGRRSALMGILESILFPFWIVFVIGAVMAFLVFLGWGASLLIDPSQIPSEFDRRNAIFQECLLSEEFSREECIVLASGDGE